MKKLLAFSLALCLFVPVFAFSEPFFDIQKEIGFTSPARIRFNDLHQVSGEIIQINPYPDYCEIKVKIDPPKDDEIEPNMPYWSDYAYCLARFDADKGLGHSLSIGDHIDMTCKIEPVYSSVMVPYFNIITINGKEDF